MLDATTTVTTIARAALVLVLAALLVQGVHMRAVLDWLKALDPNAIAAMLLAAIGYLHNHSFRKKLASSSAPPVPAPPARPNEYPIIPTGK